MCVCVCARARACVRACVCACVRACVRACVILGTVIVGTAMSGTVILGTALSRIAVLGTWSNLQVSRVAGGELNKLLHRARSNGNRSVTQAIIE